MEVADLFGLPLDRFVAERNVLARDLRAQGRREEAADAARLRKPSVAAWAVNQVVRTQGRAVQRLFDAGDAVRAAQEQLLVGRGEGRALRGASERERAAVEELLDAARGLLTSDGHELSATVIERVADTLHAAALDQDARAQVRGGRLERELRHVGLGGGGDGGSAIPIGGRKRVAAPGRPERGRAAKKQTEDTKLQRKRADELRAARAAESAARRHAERTARAVEVAEQRRERAAQALREADDALSTARATAEAAVDAHRRAQQAARRGS